MESISMSASISNVSELAKSQNTNAVKTANVQSKEEPPKKEAAGNSAPKSMPEGGTITYSKDGDSFENKASAATTVTETANSAGASSSQTSETDSESSSNSTTEAANMLAQGYSDSKIKEKTGVSQQEIDNMRAKQQQQESSNQV